MMLKNMAFREYFRTLFVPCKKDMPTRRYDLDWLRIAVFGLLILYHTGMFYVESWGWHVKSQYLSQPLENIMLIVEPWRMAVLWIIAGIAIRFVIAKVSVGRFIFMRSLRLLLPLLFGILIVVPPQLFAEMTANGDLNMSYLAFLNEFFSSNSTIFNKYQAGIWPHIDVNHLWFIRSLWQYSLALLLFLPLLNSQVINRTVQWLFDQHGVVALFFAILPIFIIQIAWDINETRYPLGFTFMVYGYLIGWNKRFWQRISQNIKPLFLTSLVLYLALITFYNLVWLDVIKGQPIAHQGEMIFGMAIYSSLRILGVLTVFALSYKYLNKPSKKLSYFNDAVYPFYIIHQTAIVVIGFNLSSYNLGPVLEPLLLLLLTVITCFLTYEFILRTQILRPFFGLKLAGNFKPIFTRLGYVAGCLLIVPIGWEIVM